MCNYYTNLASVLQASKLEIWGGIQAEASDINIICRTALQSWSLFPLGKAIMINFVTLYNPFQLPPLKQGMEGEFQFPCMTFSSFIQNMSNPNLVISVEFLTWDTFLR
jgi:hypothetical protein